MKRLAPFLLLWAALFPLLPSSDAASRAEQWKKVQAAMEQGLPQTAIEALQPIIREALTDKAYGEAAKAIAQKIVLEGNIQGNKPEEKIRRMQEAIATAPREITPVLDTLLAHWYWHYFQNNRWRFLGRTATAEAPGDEFTAWDLPRLFAEIDRQFARALAAADDLKTVPIADYGDLLQKGTMADSYRPTLYDFIAHEALEFYTSGEQAGARPEDPFELLAGSPIFGPVKEFMLWKPEATATNAPALQAIRVYQELLKFHEKDEQRDAFLDADLARLVYGHNTAFGDEKNARFKAALKRLVDEWGDHDLAASALYYWARTLQEEGDLVEARQLALRGATAFRHTPRGKFCHNLVTEIEAKSLQVSTERVWNAPWPKLQVHYRNVTQVHFRAVSYEWETFLDRKRNRPESLNQEERRELLRRAPALRWSAQLPATADYKARTEELPVPQDLRKGYYFLIASHNPDFTDVDNLVTFTDVWVSDLALVIRPRDGWIEGLVLQANSGEPVEGADVQAWYLERAQRIPRGELRTDRDGFFKFQAKENRQYLVRARHEGDAIASARDYGSHPPQGEPVDTQAIFFTDRALYRPGQTIQYKGILIRLDWAKDNYTVVPGREVTVVLADPNGQEIARQKRRSNDYGSIAGSFTAPRDRLLGTMRIHLADGPEGNAFVNVEEYKRPKFRVTLQAPKTAPRLNGKVSVPGEALSYTGAAVDGAEVRYRVVREVRFPPWWGWFRGGGPQGGSQEIAHGNVRTERDGTFQVEFVAKPDPSVPEKDEPTFSFQVHVDVTDSAGETRSDQRQVNVGYAALQARLSTEDWQTHDAPVELTIRTETLDGESQQAEGVVKVYRLKEPEEVRRPPLQPGWYRGGRPTGGPDDVSDPNQWALGELAAERGFTTDGTGKALVQVKLDPGLYRAMLETQDRFGKTVTARLPVQILDPAAPKLSLRIPHLLAAPKWTVEPGESFWAVWGTGYEQGRALIEIEHRHQIIRRYWTEPGRTQARIEQAVTEAMRGGFMLHVTRVRENRAYLDSRRVEVPWSNKQMEVKWEHFLSKLEPGQKETWTAILTGPGAEKAVAEMVATLYDQSLDAFRSHDWQRAFSFRFDHSSAQPEFLNAIKTFQYLQGRWKVETLAAEISFRSFPPDLVRNFLGYGLARARGGVREEELEVLSMATRTTSGYAPAPNAALAEAVSADVASLAAARPAAKGLEGEPPASAAAPPPAGPALDQVTARKNLNETAFFFPQLMSDSNGVVRVQFTMPEALTQWKFIGFAHDRALRSGYLEDTAVTAKDLMVQPNPPRFLREGDELEFTVKVSNQSAARQTGKVRLNFQLLEPARPPGSPDQADAQLGNRSPEQPFDIPAKESRSFSWRVKVPDSLGFLSYKTVGATERTSDGEEGYLPVLPRRILVREALALPIRGPATKQFTFKKLLDAAKSDTLRHQGLTVQMVSSPAWYAVLALPYLMEYPHQCSEQVFNRFYANTLARMIAKSDPKIHRVFEQWKNTPALDSPLQKDDDLKGVVLEETPWVREAQAESQARRNVGVLFDDNRLDYEIARALRELGEMQLGDGAWPWFPGGRGNDYITLYVVTGFGRLRHLGADLDPTPAIRALQRLDHWVDERYREILRGGHPEQNHLSSTVALYLYGRSFFLKDRPLADKPREAVDYFLGQARKYWLDLGIRQSQAHLALALHRFGDKATPAAMMKSVKERSVTDEELGRFWRDEEQSWWWYRAPIETQALMIEAFDEIMGDAAAVEGCRVWLLKQKQTQDWKTTKATADAIYALLMRGANLLASDALVEVSLGGQTIKPAQVEAGTGFYEKRFPAQEIRPELGAITVKKVDEGVAWGSVHWQYLEDLSKITPHTGTPLQLNKSVYSRVHTAQGPKLEKVKGPLKVGDELVVRIVLRTDRDMEYAHLKDQRASGTEPVNVISQYKYQDGLAYYESTRDTASHFFIDYLPKGVYVFEYASRVFHRGHYQTGIAEIQSMYAPEFNSHSESVELSVE